MTSKHMGGWFCWCTVAFCPPGLRKIVCLRHSKINLGSDLVRSNVAIQYTCMHQYLERYDDVILL